MQTLRSFFAPPDPQAQMRKCNTLLRSNMRKIDRDIAQVKQVETKTKNLILAADRRAQKNPAQRKQAEKEVRDFARELIRARKTTARLITSKAQLNSVQMQVNEAFALRKIEGSIRASVKIMKDVNTLVRLPELAGTMQELSVELMKAGIIEEMVGEQLPIDVDLEDEEYEAEGEVDKVLGEILKDRMEKTGGLPSVPEPSQKLPQQPQHAEEEPEEEDTEAMMDQMRNRLEALRS
ncbi:Vacuolar protein-sorting-associated protein 24 [Neurospora sp. IMI 360204]|uniref:Snf7-domain-containing protein n=1 Tax=Neurospora tetraspora TaxID=94610 RepID=A0AAE0JF73_9PEZI|nr:Vacuolar protein-sorting-associated protein 24 [Neurospora sp. IMI 360204]KAK3345176.1 Snf7-domain-containing protein [Neurospora tetraspora]